MRDYSKVKSSTKQTRIWDKFDQSPTESEKLTNKVGLIKCQSNTDTDQNQLISKPIKKMLSSALNDEISDENIIVGTHKNIKSQKTEPSQVSQSIKHNKVQPVSIHVISTQSSKHDSNHLLNTSASNIKNDPPNELGLNNKSGEILNQTENDDKYDSDRDMIDTNIEDKEENLSQTMKNKRGKKSSQSLNSSQNQSKYYDISEDIDSQIKQIKD